MRRLLSLFKKEDGVDIVVMIVVLAILMVFAVMFKTELTTFVSNTLSQALNF